MSAGVPEDSVLIERESGTADCGAWNSADSQGGEALATREERLARGHLLTLHGPTGTEIEPRCSLLALFGVPSDLTCHFGIPLGCPGTHARSAGSQRRQISETTYLNQGVSRCPELARL